MLADDVARLAVPLAGRDGAVAVEAEGEGWDHVAWRVTTAAGVWVVRVAKEVDASARARDARREAAVTGLAHRAVPDWVPETIVLDAAAGVTAHRRVPGVALQSLVAAGVVGDGTLAAIGHGLGRLVTTLASLPVDGLAEPLERDAGLRSWLDESGARLDAVASELRPEERAAVAGVLGAPLPPEPGPDALVLVHNDLGGEHVIVDPATLAVNGIIDWSDAASGDPASDLGRILRDLGDAALRAALDGMAAPAGERRALTDRALAYARFLALEDLAYARERRPDLVPLERAVLRRLFGA